MAFREVSVIQVKEALRRWLQGAGERPIAHGAGLSRGSVRRYITAAQTLGVDRDGGEAQLTDELIGQICELVRPSRPDGPVGDGPLARSLQPAAQSFFHLDHRYLPECHRASSATRRRRPAEPLFGRGRWTLRVVLRLAIGVVPCHWQNRASRHRCGSSAGIGGTFVRQHVLDRADGQHHEGERRLGGVKAVGPVDDEAHAPVEALVPGVVHAKANG